MDKRAFHAVADLFPMMPDDELQALADDIKINGLQVPILTDAEGLIIDGRHRYLACQRAGVEPEFRTATAPDVVALAMSLNAKRRNISAGQRAIAAAAAWDMIDTRAGPKGKPNSGKISLNGQRRDHLGTMAGVNGKYVEQARFILLNDPPAAEAVKAGTMRLSAAYEAARERKMATESGETQLAKLRGEDPELASLVAEEKLSLAEARTLLMEREAERQRQRRVAMGSLRQALSLIAPFGGTAEDKAQHFIEAWAPEAFDDGGIGPLNPDLLRAGAEVLLLLAKHADRGGSQ